MTFNEALSLRRGDVVVANSTAWDWPKHANSIATQFTEGKEYVVDHVTFGGTICTAHDDRGMSNGWGFPNFNLVLSKKTLQDCM